MANRPDIGNKRSLELYFEEIKDIEPLDSKEEIILAQQAKKGELKAFNKLVTHNLRFVVAVAKKFQGQGLPLEDLINEGNLGLIKAVDRFDETRGFRFISYAVWWITQNIRQAIQKTGRVIKLPAHVRESMGNLYRQSLEFEKNIEREPTAEELAEIMRTSPEWVDDLIKVFSEPVSLDEPIGDSETALLQLMVSNDPRPEAMLMKKSLEKEIMTVIHTLGEREKIVITYYFGIGGSKQKNLQEIANELQITGERIRQIKERALQRLRHFTRSQLLKNYIG